MIATTQKWGNSLAVRIPKTIAEDLPLKEGSRVALTIRGGLLLLRPQAQPAYRLGELLKGVTKNNLHREVDPGYPVGHEVW